MAGVQGETQGHQQGHCAGSPLGAGAGRGQGMFSAPLPRLPELPLVCREKFLTADFQPPG